MVIDIFCLLLVEIFVEEKNREIMQSTWDLLETLMTANYIQFKGRSCSINSHLIKHCK